MYNNRLTTASFFFMHANVSAVFPPCVNATGQKISTGIYIWWALKWTYTVLNVQMRWLIHMVQQSMYNCVMLVTFNSQQDSTCSILLFDTYIIYSSELEISHKKSEVMVKYMVNFMQEISRRWYLPI